MADPGVTIGAGVLADIWQVTAWPETVGDVAARVAAATGHDAPEPGAVSPGGAARIGPLVWWVFDAAPDAAARLAEIPAAEGTALDLGGGRMRFTVSGPRARDVMMRLAPIDFREAAFPEGRIVSTLAHHLNLQIARSGAGYDIYVSASFAPTLHEILTETVAQWGAAA